MLGDFTVLKNCPSPMGGMLQIEINIELNNAILADIKLNYIWYHSLQKLFYISFIYNNSTYLYSRYHHNLNFDLKLITSVIERYKNVIPKLSVGTNINKDSNIDLLLNTFDKI